MDKGNAMYERPQIIDSPRKKMARAQTIMEIDQNASFRSSTSRYVSLPTINIFPNQKSQYRTDSLQLRRKSTFSEEVWKTEESSACASYIEYDSHFSKTERPHLSRKEVLPDVELPPPQMYSYKIFEEQKTLESGESFGELALKSKKPRAATIHTIQPTAVAYLERDDFIKLMKKAEEAQDQEHLEVLRESNLFVGIHDKQMLKMLPYFKVREFRRGQVLYEEGRPALSLYFIVNGDFYMQKMVSLFSYALGPAEETRFVRLGYSLLEDQCIKEFNQYRTQVLEARHQSVLDNLKVLPMSRMLELNEPKRRNEKDIFKQQHFVKLSLMSRGHVFGLEDAIFGGDRARRLTSIVCNSERGFLLEIQAVNLLERLFGEEMIIGVKEQASMRLVQIERRLKDLIKNIIVAQHVQDTQYKERNRTDVSPSPSPRHPTSPHRSPTRSPKRVGDQTTAAKDSKKITDLGKLHIKPTLITQSPESRNQASPEAGGASPSRVRGTRSTDVSPSRIRSISQDDVPQELQLLQMNVSRTNLGNNSIRFKRGKSNLRSQRLSSTSQFTRPETPPYIRERKALSQRESLIPMRKSSPSPPILVERHSPTPEHAIQEEIETGMKQVEEEEKLQIPKKNLSNYLKALTQSDMAGTSPNQKSKHVLSLQRVNEATEDVQNMDTMSEFKNVKLSKIQSPSLLAQTLRTKHHLKELFRNQQQVEIREEQQARERIRSQRIQQAIASAFHNLQHRYPKEEPSSKDISPASFKAAVVNVPTPILEIKPPPDTDGGKKDPTSGVSMYQETSKEHSFPGSFLADPKSTPSLRLTPRKMIRLSLEGKERLKASDPPLHSPKPDTLALQTIDDVKREKTKSKKRTSITPMICATPSISPFRVLAKKQRQFIEQRRQESQPFKIHSFIQKYSRHETLPAAQTLENELRSIDARKSTDGAIEPYQLQGSPSIPCYLPKSDIGSTSHTPLYQSTEKREPNSDLALVGLPSRQGKLSNVGVKSERGISKVDLEFNDLQALKSSRAGQTVFGMTHGEQIVARAQNNTRSSFNLRKMKVKMLDEQNEKQAHSSQIQRRLQMLARKKSLRSSQGKKRKKKVEDPAIGSFQVSSIQTPQMGIYDQIPVSRAINTIQESFPKIAVPPILSQDELQYSSIMESEDRSTLNESKQISRRSFLQTPVANGRRKENGSFLDRVRSSLAFNIKGQKLDQSIEQISLIAPPPKTKYYNFNLDYRSIGGSSKTPPPAIRSAQRSARSQKSAPQRREDGLYKKARERAKLKRPKISHFQQK